MRLNYFSFLIYFLIFFSFQKTALTASHVKVNAGKCIKGDCVNGKGTFDDGVRLYEGEFKDGKYHGQGSSKRHDNGVTYQGEWKNNKPNGQGTARWPSGAKYVGGWKDNNRHGQGVQTYVKGRKYVGEFKDNKRHGQGTYTWPDGRKYSGEFKDNKRHGQGTLTLPNGKKIIAEYKNDKRIEPQAVESPEKKITNFKRTIVCKNKYNIVNLFKFKDNKVVTKSTGPGGKLKVVQGFSNVPFVKIKNIISWKGTYISSKGIKVPVKKSFDLKSMSLYTDLNIMDLSNPKKFKVNTVCR